MYPYKSELIGLFPNARFKPIHCNQSSAGFKSGITQVKSIGQMMHNDSALSFRLYTVTVTLFHHYYISWFYMVTLEQ